MEKLTPQSVGDILRLAFQENCMQDHLDENTAVRLWPRVVGDANAAECSVPKVADGIMTVGVRNASLRHELSMNRSLLRKAINDIIGKETIKDIHFIS